MYSDDDLTEAVAAGAVPVEAAEALRARVAARRHLPRVDEEHYRILDGGNDGFVALAAILVMAGLGNIGWVAQHVLAGVFVAASAWGLAEYFVRIRRQTLTGIVLSLAFFGGVVATMITILLQAAPTAGTNGLAGAVAAILAISAGATWLFWRRFAVPFAMSLVTLGAVGAVLALAVAAFAGPNLFALPSLLYPIALLCGLGAFAFAMHWDMSDPTRVTRRHEVGFWVHGVAGGLIAQPILYMIGGGGVSLMGFFFVSTGQAIATVVLVVLFAIVGLAIDRRSLVYAAIGGLLYALAGTLAHAGVYQTALGWAAVIAGAALLVLSAYWHAARRGLVPLLGGLADRLPPLEPTDEPVTY